VEQSATEKSVFLEFAPICGLPIHIETVESRTPPEPDIVCHVDGSGLVGFELTELVDREFMARIGLMAKTRQKLAEAWKTGLSDGESNEFRQRFGNALLHFVYRPETSQNKRQTVTLPVLRELLNLPNGFEGIALREDPAFSAVLEEVRVDRGGFRGPVLDVDSAGWLGDPTAPAIRKKLSKTYECDYPLELLAYIDIDLLPPEDAWIAAAEEASAELAASPFRKLWVFDRSAKAIRYERPA
jgi:hypothetical protein